eukprot:TRINITY_DN9498_c0_g1_i2.p1 TRINITY_DN9498_c0_g1~~TRINITY_DN9498_c0_g1_i2.p1  ORF type:complete len:524 (+),score=85.23 TRINITY_DN9498_c0_g1_i2:2634-4205(+)
MADELNALRERARPPLPGFSKPSQKRSLPIRQPEASEEEMFDDLVGSASRAASRQDNAVFSTLLANSSRLPSRGAPSETDMIATMAGRLRTLEKQVKVANEEILHKDNVIAKLRKELKLQQLVQQAQTTNKEDLIALEAEHRKLQNQVHAMEAFLADYGMVWVGDESDVDATDDADLVDDAEGDIKQQALVADDDTEELSVRTDVGTTTASEQTDPAIPFVINHERIIENIQELNVLAGAGSAKIVSGASGGRLQVQESIPLKLYNNGILMFNGPFRSADDQTTQMFLRDLQDGYFPWELRSRYPDGVPFALQDLRHETYTPPVIQSFPGSGQALGGTATTSVLLRKPSSLFETDSSTTPQAPESRQRLATTPASRTSEHLLARLPQTVIHNGCIMDVRAGLQQHVSVGQRKHRVTLVSTPVAQFLASRVDTSNAEDAQRPQTPRDVASLQVKSEDANETMVLKMRFNDTIADIRKCLDNHRGAHLIYDIYTSFPRKILNDPQQTLIDANLVPNATLRLKKRK